MKVRLHYSICALVLCVLCVGSLFSFLPDTTKAQGPHYLFLPLVATRTPSPTPDPGPVPGGNWQTGEGTYYAATGAGNCSFDATPDNLMVAAMNHTDYAGSQMCGAFVQVEGPRGEIIVRIVDRCPECAAGDIDLSREAFALIADPVDGRVPIRWRIVSPELAGPIVYHFKEGGNQWWTAVQIRNHRNPIATFEYRDETGQFQTVPREMYNYFVDASGMGPGPYTFRVTDIYGNTLTDSGIPLLDDGSASGSQQFPAPTAQ